MLSFFIVLPFGVRTNEEGSGERVPGHAESARHRFSFGRAALRATIVSAAAFLLFYLNYVYGWIGVSDLN